MKHFIAYLIIGLCFISCDNYYKNTATYKNIENDITCTENGCNGTYKGAEFIFGDDIAHKFSNKMSNEVGHQLKELYKNENYKKVDFSKIHMTTVGMGSGEVIYSLSIPFIQVVNKCDAYTSFDHVGGWNHSPELSKRKQAISTVLMKGHELDISALKTTPEGLQEFWIQWKNKDVQAECK